MIRLTLKNCTSGPNRWILLTLEIEEAVSKNKVLKDNSLRLSSELGGKVLMKLKTLLMSKVATYLGSGGLKRKTALTACETSGWQPMLTPLNPKCNFEIEERW